MASRTRKTPAEGETVKSLSFEQALEELESIVEQMENQQLPLNELIDQYEKGVRLFSTCDQLLGKARKRLELITLKAREEHASPSVNTVDSESSGDGESDDDDIRLF